MTDPVFTLDHYREQIRQIRRLGSMRDIAAMIPGMKPLLAETPEIGTDLDMRHVEGIISAMTRQERSHPEVIDTGRRVRIARGSGTDPSDVDKLLRDFSAVRSLMDQLAVRVGLERRRFVRWNWKDADWRQRLN